jgi:hypothetical protein
MLSGSLGYIIGASLPNTLSGACLPPPFDRDPKFPAVYFTLSGEPVLGQPTGSSDTTIYQIVPSDSNPYSRRYGGVNPTTQTSGEVLDRRLRSNEYRDWDPPEVVLETVQDWFDLGVEIVFHPRRPGICVSGVSRGKSRFLCGGGVYVYVVRELGMLPEGGKVNGVTMERMVATFGVAFPGSGNQSTAYHIFPSEYLVDPALPGLPGGLSYFETLRWLPPPPLFGRDLPVADGKGLVRSRVEFDVSVQEESEAGGTVMGLTLRGRSYYLLQGVSA